MPVLRGETQPVRDRYYSQTLASPQQSSMITDGIWKYIYSEANATEELYDQTTDPGETVNLALDPPHHDRCRSMRRELVQLATELGDTAIMDGNDLRSTPLDRASLRELPRSSMGWRWY